MYEKGGDGADYACKPVNVCDGQIMMVLVSRVGNRVLCKNVQMFVGTRFYWLAYHNLIQCTQA